MNVMSKTEESGYILSRKNQIWRQKTKESVIKEGEMVEWGKETCFS